MAAPGAHMRIFLCLLKCITIQLANENPGPQSTCVLNQTPVACSASCPGKESPVALVPPLFCLIALCLAGPMNPLHSYLRADLNFEIPGFHKGVDWLAASLGWVRF